MDRQELLEAVPSRHSVRSFIERPIDEEIVGKIQAEVDRCNAEGGLDIRFIVNDSELFDSFLARRGKFKNVRNGIVMAGKDTPDLEEKVGYYGEQLVLLAQTLGLNTCWVGLTYNKKHASSAASVGADEKMVLIIAIGRGTTSGVSHDVKKVEEVCDPDPDMPDWYRKGIECALLAPTAVNQQKFKFSRNGNVVSCSPGSGFFTKVDMGIVKFHFELGAGTENFIWA
ncbi:MAG: nitroreductase family protein [Coriobacteriales bacterium]|jgi:hypothetical protein